MSSIEIHFPTIVEFSQTLLYEMKHTAVVPIVAGAIVIAVAGGVILIGIAIWSKAMSFELNEAKKPAMK